MPARCIFRYHGLRSDLTKSQCIYNAVERTRRENKRCLIMGDFNLDLLKYNSHLDTDNFFNAILLNCFQAHILQPTRITGV